MGNNTTSPGDAPLEAYLAGFLFVAGVFIVYLLQRETALSSVQALGVVVLAALLLVAIVLSLPGQWRMIRAKGYGWRINQHHRKQSPFTKTVGRVVVTYIVELGGKGQAWVQSVVTRESDPQSADDETPTNTEDE